jgi:hypothetical protein
MLSLKISLSIAALLLVIKVVRNESGTFREKFEYIMHAVTGKSVWRMPTVQGVHDAYHSAYRAAYAISA